MSCKCMSKRCGGGSSTREKSTVLTEYPQVLSVHAMRFSGDGRKIESKTVGLRGSLQVQLGDARYELRSTEEHVGSRSDRGHYRCFAKVEDGRNPGYGTWLCFDDENVTTSGAEAATARPYLAFFEKIADARHGEGAAQSPMGRSSNDGCHGCNSGDACSIQLDAGVHSTDSNADCHLIADIAPDAKGSRTNAAEESTPVADDEKCTELIARSVQQNGDGGPNPNFPNAALAFFAKNFGRPKSDLFAELAESHNVDTSGEA